MENKVFEENLKIISTYNTKLCDLILRKNLEKSNILLSQNVNGEYNLIFNNNVLHNQENAIEESKKIVECIQDKNNKNSIRIVWGLGLGYLADCMASVIEEAKIIIYEPNLDILKFVLNIAKIDALFKKNVFICSNNNDLKNLVNEYCDSETNISISFLSSYKKLFEKEIKESLDIVQYVQGEKIASKNTFKGYGIISLENTFRNLKKIIQSPDITSLKDFYKDKTALILGAGASLKENIETVKENQQKVIIFALSQTLSLLAENDIKPDFIVNIDAIDNFVHFKNINPDNFNFIFEPSCYNRVHRMNSKKVFNYISENNYFNFWLKDCLNVKNNLQTTGTVSYTAFMSAILMGFNKIILLGQDLAYKDGKCYSTGTCADNLECVYEEKLKKYVIKAKDFDALVNSMKKDYETIENCQKRMTGYIEKLNESITTITGQKGEKLPTQISYKMFLDSFNESASKLKKQNQTLELINSSVGGADIVEFKNLSLEEALKKEDVIEKPILDEISADYDKNRILSKIQKLKGEIQNLSDLFKNISEIDKKIIKELEIKKIFTQNCEKLIKKHKELLNSILNIQGSEINYIMVCFVLKFENLIKKNFYANEEILKETLIKLEKHFEYIIKKFDIFIDKLADCESFILQ